MNAHISEWLAAYHDGELRGRRLAQVEAHLAACPACLAELEQLESLSTLLSEAPEAPVLTAPDRFAAQVGLRLKRRHSMKQAPAAGKNRVWAFLPVTLLIGLGFLQIVQWLAAGLSLAQALGFGNAAVARLTRPPVQSSTLLAELPFDRLPIGIPFSPQVLVGIVLPAVLAVAYLLWLIVWGLNQQEIETI